MAVSKQVREAVIDGAGREADPAARSKQAASQFKVLADPTRVLILDILSRGERCVGALVADVGEAQPAMSQTAMSHHISNLRLSAMVEPTRRGKNNFYVLTDKGRRLVAAIDALMS